MYLVGGIILEPDALTVPHEEYLRYRVLRHYLHVLEHGVIQSFVTEHGFCHAHILTYQSVLHGLTEFFNSGRRMYLITGLLPTLRYLRRHYIILTPVDSLPLMYSLACTGIAPLTTTLDIWRGPPASTSD